MILITCAFIFAAIVSVALGFHMMSVASRRELIRRRLATGESHSDILDPTLLRQQRMSSISLLNRFIAGIRPAQRLQLVLSQAGMEMRVVPFVAMSLSLGLICALLAQMLTQHLVLTWFVGISLTFVPLMIVVVRKERRVRAFNDHFPDALDMMINALKAGFALNGAIQMVADESPDPVAQEFRILYEEQQLGLDIRQALNNLATRVDSTDVGLFVTAILIQRDTGGNLAEVLEKIAYVIRDRFRIMGEVRTFTTQGRLTGIILALLPIFFAVTMGVLSPEYMQIMLETRTGQLMLNVAIILQVLGFLSIRRIVNIKI